jgi:predicted ATPase
VRGITNSSTITPLGINGEGLDLLLSTFDDREMEQLKYFGKKCISWIDDFFYDEGEILKRQGYKLGRSTSNLYFRDKYMQKKENVFSAENANEGALHLLFYLALFISKKTPPFFAVDNIETGMNPELCRSLITYLCELSQANNKQALITTHNPAILNGLNLHDDNQRLFVVTRRDDGQTRVERIKLKPNIEGQERMMLSELWMRGFLGGVPDNF